MAFSLTARKVATRVGARAFSAKAALPDLAYDYAALEPHVSAQIMEVCVCVCVESYSACECPEGPFRHRKRGRALLLTRAVAKW